MKKSSWTKDQFSRYNQWRDKQTLDMTGRLCSRCKEPAVTIVTHIPNAYHSTNCVAFCQACYDAFRDMERERDKILRIFWWGKGDELDDK